MLDLGEAWTGLTGLPFVYACWTGPPGALAGSQASILVRALTLGLSCVHDIADDHAEGHPGSPEFYRRYLQQSISYHLGEDELAGLRLFYRYAEDLGLVDRQPDLSFYPLI